jgi:hypothetical protein
MSVTLDDLGIPEAIKRLPRDARGYPIPWAQFRGDDGAADFRTVDQGLVDRCIDERLCGICGEQLAQWVVFIGGPACLTYRLFKDPAMHPACAAFAAIACPFIAGAYTRYSTAPPPSGPGVASHVDPNMQDHIRRPSRMYLFTTRGFRRKRVGREVYIYAAPYAKVDEVRLDADRFVPGRCPVATEAGVRP